LKNTKLNFLSILICFLFKFSFSQNLGILTGRVVDSKTLFPLQGATILIEGESLGTISDENGYFKLEEKELKKIKENFAAEKVNDADTLRIIKDFFVNYGFSQIF